MITSTDKEFLEMLLITISGYLHEKYKEPEFSGENSLYPNSFPECKPESEEKNKRQEKKSVFIPQGKAEKVFYEKLMKTLDKK